MRDVRFLLSGSSIHLSHGFVVLPRARMVSKRDPAESSQSTVVSPQEL